MSNEYLDLPGGALPKADIVAVEEQFEAGGANYQIVKAALLGLFLLSILAFLRSIIDAHQTVFAPSDSTWDRMKAIALVGFLIVMPGAFCMSARDGLKTGNKIELVLGFLGASFIMAISLLTAVRYFIHNDPEISSMDGLLGLVGFVLATIGSMGIFSRKALLKGVSLKITMRDGETIIRPLSR
jgi:hypothetical protein